MNQPGPIKPRFAFIDLMRGLAMVMMVETHVFNSLLQPELKLTAWFKGLDFVNGLIAPSFLFISGMAFAIATGRKIEEFRRWGIEFWRQMGRIALIWVTGYILRFPFPRLRDLVVWGIPKDWANLYAVDVLHCIAFGLMGLLLLRLLIRSDKVYQWLLLISGVLIGTTAIFFWPIEYQPWVHVGVANYFTRSYGSQFPLLPWLAYMFFGAVYGMVYVRWRSDGRESVLMKRTVWIGVVLAVMGHVWLTVLSHLPRSYRLFPDPVLDPFYSSLKLGYVLLILVACRWFCERRPGKRLLITEAGRESLLVYALHLQILYQKLWFDRGLSATVHKSFSFGQAAAFSVALALAMVLAAKAWGSLKRASPEFARWIVISLVFVLLLIFFW